MVGPFEPPILYIMDVIRLADHERVGVDHCELGRSYDPEG